jgi:RHS repeat-associated protein
MADLEDHKTEAVKAPAISLPKGGGAIRGMGEKFAANPVTGTGSLTVPIYTSPGRSGFGPGLSLSYDSGAGNGSFGFGWDLSLASVTRKTEKGLPKYQDANESDEFILSGAEDLVPILVKDGEQWEREALPPRTIAGKTYRIQRYQPRIEGLFARIERWTNLADSKDTFWRSISRDNITTWYGKTDESRIADPADPTRIFSWLICESYDDKGNGVVYGYKHEDSTAVDTSQAHERNRNEESRSANRYLKRINYGNLSPYYPKFSENEPPTPLPSKWLFEVVFDYGDHDLAAPSPNDSSSWPCRHDPFSSYRAGFEVRTYRLCQRVLMFHHFPDEEAIGADCLVRSTNFTYSYEKKPADPRNPIHSVLVSVSQCGYKRKAHSGYLKKSLPPLELEYSQASIHEEIREVDPESLENLPYGLDNAHYQWVDLDGEGLSGMLTEQAEGWFYKPNLSPINTRREHGRETVEARFGPVELVAERPSLAAISEGRQQFLDLAGDGQLDLVELEGPTPGFYERTHDERWKSHRSFESLPVLKWGDPNLKFVDLTGDGHADVLISEDEVFCWFPSLAEAGFGPPERVRMALDEENGPRLVFADGTQSIYLADMSGDGLIDIARIRNGEVCYWPNLGYGRFGAKVTMDNAPWFDAPDTFDQRRMRLADIDGTGNIDILYLASNGIQVYFNQSGNSWSVPTQLTRVPPTDNVKSVTVVDLLGNGIACLVWSSPLPGDARRPMRYMDLMGGHKPYLLTKVVNNLGAETHIQYAPSTRFYLADKRDGKPWITRLPFPVQVVERVETHDRISRNCFVTRYAYHHGYFDGIEREFRGFGMVEQWDTEHYETLEADGLLEGAENLDGASHVPPVLTKTWFHTGAYFEQGRISRQFEREYYREGGPTLLLKDTVLPTDNLTSEEIREACRSLKGAMLRQEVYGLDGSDKEPHPYTVTEQNFTIRLLQRRAGNRHAVFFTHARETLNYHYERDPEDPRVSHALTLEVDDYGNVLKALAVGYGRRNPSADAAFTPADHDKQTRLLITYTENSTTNPIDETIKNLDGSIKFPDAYRAPLPAETRTYELTGYEPQENADRFRLEDWTSNGFAWLNLAAEIGYEETPSHATKQKRLIEDVRICYRKDDLTALRPLGQLEPLALPGESYTLAFIPALLDQVYTRRRTGQPDEPLLPADPAELTKLLGGKGPDEGGYVQIDGNWWIPTGQVFYSDDPGHTSAQEKAEAQAHFYLPRRYRDPFDQDTLVEYDGPADPAMVRYDLLATRTTDALGNTITAENDYRVLQPELVTDANRNRTAAAFDALGLVVATAVMGKEGEGLGDLLEGFDPDPSVADLQQFVADPQGKAASLLGKATTRILYDLERFTRAGDSQHPECGNQPPFAATLARETHVHELGDAATKIQIGFTYSDGFGREIQKKIQAEPGKAPQREAPVVMASGDTCPGDLKRDGQGKPVTASTERRWVGTGRTVFNNKGNPVRQYEPFFSATHLYEREPDMTDTGVSPVLFYDPLERVVATLHPDHTYEKVLFDPWRQITYDVNDSVAARGDETGDPRTDPDIAGYVAEYFKTQLPIWQTWHGQRIGGQLGAAELDAAKKAAGHANTPTVAHLDTLGRPFLTIAHNRVVCPNHSLDGTEDQFQTRVELDIEGNQRAIIDAKGRLVMRYDYDIAGPAQDEDDEEAPDSIHQSSMEAGERWVLNDVAGNPIRAWDSRGFIRRLTYDALRRPTGLHVIENGNERLAERTLYGEGQGDADNHRARVYQVRDAAGIVTSVAYDFKGNLKESRRDLLPMVVSKQGADWQQNPAANDGSYTSKTEYDALNRPHTQISPDKSMHRYSFNEANLLETIEVNLRGAGTATPFVTNIDYNAKGQREQIAYANGATTKYEYDPLTFRLTQLTTTRPAGRNGLASQIFTDTAVVQDLRYAYDPAGNITQIADAALKTVSHAGQIDPICYYTYDALYRLIESKGREHIGQTALTFHPSNRRDCDYAGLAHFNAHPNDLQALRNYTEQYVYDAVGNIEQLNHGTWTREYDYEEDSLLEQPGVKNNRLTRTRVGSHTETYSYSDALGNDVHGCMTAINSMKMVWDFEDQLQEVDLGGGGTAYYIYDASGERVRKVIERHNGTLQKERLYLGGVEIYRDYDGSGTNKTLERETLHVMDDQQRVALVETQTMENGNPVDDPVSVQRYQLGNHLGSASLELSENAALISYEEYHPYGTTAFQAGRTAAELSLKRYRYTGKERDEGTGLSYHGARYYAAWLGRWISPDPAQLRDGLSTYVYARSSPFSFKDTAGTQSIPFDYSYARHHKPSLEERAKQAVSQFEQWRKRCTNKMCAPPSGWHFVRTGKDVVPIYMLTGPQEWPKLRLVYNRYHSSVEQLIGPYGGHQYVTSLGSYSSATYRWKVTHYLANNENLEPVEKPLESEDPIAYATGIRAAAKLGFAVVRKGTGAALKQVKHLPLQIRKAGKSATASVQSEAVQRVRLVERMQQIVDESARIADEAIRTGNRAVLSEFLTPREVNAILRGRCVNAFRGTFVEWRSRLMFALDKSIQPHVGRGGYLGMRHVVGKGPRRAFADFFGTDKGLLSGIAIDITTHGQRAAHLARGYLEKGLVLTY